MPYQWTEIPPAPDAQELHLWAYNALPKSGVALMVLVFFAFAALPLVAMVGTVAFWAVLPFMLLAMWGLDYALRRNQADRHITEVLTLAPTKVTLQRTNPKGPAHEWHDNPYWTKVTLHPDSGPVPNYVTLKGTGREVEIGAFLSEEERIALYEDLTRALARVNSP